MPAVTRFCNTISKAERGASRSTRCLRGRPFGFPLWPFWNRPVRGERYRSDVSLTLRPPQHAQVRPRHTGPASDRYVDVSRIDVEAAKAPSHPLGSNECRPRAEEEVENEVTATRHVLDRIGHQSAGLDRRMQGQILATATLERIDGGIVPDVRAIASVLAQLHRVEMRHVADPEHEYQLMLRAIERSHSRIGLIPDADVQKIAVNRFAYRRDVIHVAPVDTDKVHCPVA